MVSIDTTCSPSEDDIVISGFSGRFPKSDNLEELSSNLFNRADLMEIFDNPSWKNTLLKVPKRGGKMNDINKFDGIFFGMYRKQASSYDVMARLTLEKACEAIVDAGLHPMDLSKTNTLVICNQAISETEQTWLYSNHQSGREFLGRSRALLSNRLSFWLNINAPSYTLISFESGGIEAITLAYNGIKNGFYEAALIGSVGLVLLPEVSYQYQGLGFLSPDGQTKSFDETANGYGRTDGIAVMLLQKAKDAKRVYATIVHSAAEMNVKREAPLIRPMRDAFSEILENFYEECGVDPRTVQFLEADGTGIKLWDEEELNAVDRVFLRNRKSPLLIGSIKSNLGHANAASNLFSVAKVLIAMQEGQIPPNINYNKPSPNVPALVENRLKVVTEATPWKGGLAAVNTFGMTGTYGHLLLRSFERKKSKQNYDKLPRLLLMSGRSLVGLENVLLKVGRMPTDVEFVRLVHEVFSKTISNHLYRGYTLLPAGDEPIREVKNVDAINRPVWFIFSGMGSQWPGMGRELMKLPVCAATINKCHDILAEKGLDLKHIITTKDASIFDTILHCFVGIAAIQLALVDLLTTMGIKPDGMLGHSVGELGCAYADGCLTLEQMLLSAYYRGMASLQADLIKGYMAAVGLGHRQLKKIVPEEVDIACHNSGTSATISGPEGPVKKFVEQLKSEGVFAKVVNVANIAYHSRYIQPAGPLLLNSLQKLIPEPKRRSSKWICTSVPEKSWNTPLAQSCSAEYLTNNLLSSVLFEEGSDHIPKNAIAIEIAPHGLLQAILRRSMSPECTNIALADRSHAQGLHFLLAAIGKIYLSGPLPQVANIYPPVQFPVSQGTPSLASLITWDHGDNWLVLENINAASTTSGEVEFEVNLRKQKDKFLEDHVIDGQIFLPTFTYLELAWQTLAQVKEADYKSMPVVFEDLIFHKRVEIQKKDSLLLYVMYQHGSGKFEICKDKMLILSGRIEESKEIENEFVKMPTEPISYDDVIVSGEDLYKEFEHRGYQFKGNFKSIIQTELSNKGAVATVKWTGNWVMLGEALLQLALLQMGEKDQNLLMPSTIRRIVINPLEHMSAGKGMKAVYTRSANIVHCGSIEIQDIRTLPLQPSETNVPMLRLETTKICKYIHPHVRSVEQFMDLCLQLALENCYRQNTATSMTAIEFAVVQNSRNLLQPLRNVLPKYPQVSLKTIFAALKKNMLLEEKLNCSLIMVTRSEAFKEAKGLLKNGFLLVVSADKETWSADSNLVTVVEYHADGCKYVLLRNAYPVNSQISQVLHMRGDVSSWMDELRKMGSCERLYMVVDLNPDYLRRMQLFVKKLTEDSEMAHVRSVFLCDKNAPAFSLHMDFYQQQLFRDLVTNIYYEGEWRSFFSVPLPLGHDNNDLLHDSQLLSMLSIDDIKIQYLGLNPISMDFTEDINEDNKKIGLLEFAGITGDRKRVMGVAHKSEDESFSKVEHLTWQVPESWSLEEAATVPLAASLAYYALFMKVNVQHGHRVVVHAGWTSFSQAAIALALDYKCTVFTTVTNMEQRMCIKKQFPQARDLHILNMETYYQELYSKTDCKGVDVVLNTLSGQTAKDDINYLVPCGSFVQLARNDLKKGKAFGMFKFGESCVYYTVKADNLFNLPPELRKELHAAVEDKIQNDVIKPLSHHVFHNHQSQEALRSLFNMNHVGRVVLHVSAEKIPITQPVRFRCEPQSAYLVSGGNAEQCLNVVDWLVSHGAHHIVLTLHSNVVSGLLNRQIGLLKYYRNIQLVLISSPAITSVSSAANLLQSATSSVGGNISGIFILPTEERGQENGITTSTVAHLDAASRNISSLRHFVCFLSEGSWATCEARRLAGFPAIAILQNYRKSFHLKKALKALDTILVTEHQETVITVSDEINNDDQDIDVHQSAALKLFLPSSLEELTELGEEVLSCKTCCWEEMVSKSPGYAFVKEVPPVFVIPGLQGPSVKVLHPLIRCFGVPAFYAKLPSRIPSIPEIAATLVQQMQEIQTMGTYNLVGVSWGGALTIELAQRLEAQGHEIQIVLLDGALDSSLNTLKVLGHDSNMETNLICRLLQITNSKVQGKINCLPDWSSRLNHALSECTQNVKENEMLIRAGLTAIRDRITSIQQYKQPDMLLDTKMVFVQPEEQSKGYCDLTQFFSLTLTISVVEGDHRTMLSNSKVAKIINESVM